MERFSKNLANCFVSKEDMSLSFLGVSVNHLLSWQTPFCPLFLYVAYMAPQQSFQFLLAFSRSLAAIVSTVPLSFPENSAIGNTQISTLSPCSQSPGLAQLLSARRSLISAWVRPVPKPMHWVVMLQSLSPGRLQHS